MRIALGPTAAALLLFASPLLAQTTYTWTTITSGNASGSWNTGTWSPVGPANGIDNVADFSTLDITATSTVTLDGTFTIGTLKFGDTATASAASWVLSTGNLTLQTTALSGPFIQVNALGTGATVTISAVLAGTQGFTKTGAGTLFLSGANTYTGTTTVNAGVIMVTNGLNGGTGTPLTFAGTGGFTFSGAANASQGMGTLNFAGGRGAVTSTYAGSGSGSLTFTSLATRSAGATGNLVLSGGINNSTNKIAITARAAGFVDRGVYFNGADFAYYDPLGFVRAPNYGGGGDVGFNTTFVAGPTNSGHVRLTANFTGVEHQLCRR